MSQDFLSSYTKLGESGLFKETHLQFNESESVNFNFEDRLSLFGDPSYTKGDFTWENMKSLFLYLCFFKVLRVRIIILHLKIILF